jgi:hypothetical protein
MQRRLVEASFVFCCRIHFHSFINNYELLEKVDEWTTRSYGESVAHTIYMSRVIKMFACKSTGIRLGKIAHLSCWLTYVTWLWCNSGNSNLFLQEFLLMHIVLLHLVLAKDSNSWTWALLMHHCITTQPAFIHLFCTLARWITPAYFTKVM